LQCQADVLGLPVLQSPHSESTGLGAALLAGLHAGVWPDLDSLRRLPQQGREFRPRMAEEERRHRLDVWHRAVQAVIAFYTARN
jgi:glycerol kinase